MRRGVPSDDGSVLRKQPHRTDGGVSHAGSILHTHRRRHRPEVLPQPPPLRRRHKRRETLRRGRQRQGLQRSQFPQLFAP